MNTKCEDLIDMTRIDPVLLAPGSGKHFWFLSRKSNPKHFSNLIVNKTVFHQFAVRMVSLDTVGFSSQIIENKK